MKVLLIDHHALFRAGLCHVLWQLPCGVDKILEAGSFSDGLKLAGQHPGLDLVLLELKSPGCGGVLAVKLFRWYKPHIPVVVVSSEEDPHVINQALDYGANGFVCKSSTRSTLLDTISLALSRGIYMPPQLLRQTCMAAKNKNSCDDSRRSNTNEYGLTARQMDILGYLAEGFSNKEIAKVTDIAEGTVKAHVAAVYRTLHVKSRVEAIRAAKQLGLVSINLQQARHQWESQPSC